MGANPVLFGLVLNAGILLGMALIAAWAPQSLGQATRLRARLFTGVLVAAFGMAVMLAPVEFADGVVFDVRSVVLSLSGLFFGFVPTAIAVSATSLLRWVQGGVGVPYGIAVIVASGAVGVAWRRWRGESVRGLRPLELYGFGLVVHVVMVAILSTLPAPVLQGFWQQVAGPVLVIYPLATLIVGRLLVTRFENEARRDEQVQREIELRVEAERSEQRYSAALQRLELLMQHAPAALAMFDRDLRYTAVSRRYVDDFDLHGRELIGRFYYDAFPEIPEHSREANRRALAGETVEGEDDGWFVRADGTKMWTRWEVRPWFDDQGEIGGIVLLTENLTRLVEGRREIEKLSRAVEQSPESIVITNVDAEIEYVNDAFLQSSGFTRDEVIGQNPRILNSGETPPATYQEMWATLSEGRAWRGEFINRRKDGSTYVEEATISPVRDVAGEVTHYVAVKDDVTKQRRTERELEEHRSHLERLVDELANQAALFESVIKAIPDAVVYTDIERKVVGVNPAFTAILGFNLEDLRDKTTAFFYESEQEYARQGRIRYNLTAAEAARPYVVSYRRKDGSTFPGETLGTAIKSADGTTLGFIGVIRDITERRKAEAQLREQGEELVRHRDHLEELVDERTAQLTEAQQLAESANVAKSVFLASMSHEIRTPLNAIVGLTHLLLRDDPTRHQRDRLGKVDHAAQHLLSIINDVLDVAKIEAGKMVLDDRDFHLSAVLDHVRSIIAASAEAKGVTVDVDRDHVPFWLRGDAARLRQALLNLAGNAVKFTERGTIHVRSDLVEETDRGLTVRFEVEDTGIGVDADVLPTLFDDFEQGDTPVGGNGGGGHGGTGLGLAITRRLAELMGGEVGMESTPGVGTRVWFTCKLQRGRGIMPSGVEENATSEPRPVEANPFAGKTVLLAEDNAINREVAVELLHGFGLDVETAGTGREAVERARRRAYDLILMDVHMPEMNGLDATRSIRSRSANSHVPILAMTANAFEDDRKACYAAGMNDFVAKPVNPPRLRSTLTEWLSRAATVPAEIGSGARTVDEESSRPTEAAGNADAGEAGSDGASTRAGAWQWDGLDAAAGLSVVNGDEARYLLLLRRFATTHAEDAHHLRRDLAAGSLDAVRQRAHALHGVAGTLGAWRLREAASELERSLRSGETPDPRAVDKVGEELGELVQRVSALPDVGADAPSSETTPVSDILSRLRSLLAEDRPEAAEWHGAHRATLRQALGADAAELEAAIERYDFIRARDVLARRGDLGG